MMIIMVNDSDRRTRCFLSTLQLRRFLFCKSAAQIAFSKDFCHYPVIVSRTLLRSF